MVGSSRLQLSCSFRRFSKGTSPEVRGDSISSSVVVGPSDTLDRSEVKYLRYFSLPVERLRGTESLGSEVHPRVLDSTVSESRSTRPSTKEPVPIPHPYPHLFLVFCQFNYRESRPRLGHGDTGQIGGRGSTEVSFRDTTSLCLSRLGLTKGSAPNFRQPFVCVDLSYLDQRRVFFFSGPLLPS